MTVCSEEKLAVLGDYLKAVKLFRSYDDQSEEPQYSEVCFWLVHVWLFCDINEILVFV